MQGRKSINAFLMTVDDVFTIAGRGIVAVGLIKQGKVNVNDKIQIAGLLDKARDAVVYGIEMHRELHDSAEVGDSVGILLQGFKDSEIVRGQVLVGPGSIKPLTKFTKFTGDVYHLTKDECGRSTPLFSGFRPQFAFRTALISGLINLPEGVPLCNTGESMSVKVELDTPVAVEQGLRFEIRNGGRVVSTGIISEILQFFDGQ
jgi:elongation factor Tu